MKLLVTVFAVVVVCFFAYSHGERGMNPEQYYMDTTENYEYSQNHHYQYETTEDNRRHQEATEDYGRHEETTGDYGRQYEITEDYGRQYETTEGYDRHQEPTEDYGRQYETTEDYSRQREVTEEYRRHQETTDNYENYNHQQEDGTTANPERRQMESGTMVEEADRMCAKEYDEIVSATAIAEAREHMSGSREGKTERKCCRKTLKRMCRKATKETGWDKKKLGQEMNSKESNKEFNCACYTLRSQNSTLFNVPGCPKSLKNHHYGIYQNDESSVQFQVCRGMQEGAGLV